VGKHKGRVPPVPRIWGPAKPQTQTGRPGVCLSLAISIVSTALALTTGCDSHPQSVTTPEPVAAASTPTPAPEPHVSESHLSEPGPFTTTGPLVADQQADIAVERDGRIATVQVQIGDRVKTGQVLATLDDRALRAACDAQRARIASAKAEVTDWEAEEQSAKADLRRADQMLADKIISAENWEHVKYKLDETVAEVAKSKSTAAEAEANLSAAQIQLDQSRILAPFSGIVGRSTARTAQQVKTGDVLFWITAESPLRVLFTVPESSMAGFSKGAPIALTTPDYPDLHQPGRVLRVSPVVDPASGSVQVVGEIVHPSPLLKPGMSMQIRLAQTHPDQAHLGKASSAP
jgi:RND family efflux transporter MFP subunit